FPAVSSVRGCVPSLDTALRDASSFQYSVPSPAARSATPALVTDVMGVICLALRSAPRDDERDAACSKECRIAPRAICTPWERIAAGGGRLIGRARAISL